MNIHVQCLCEWIVSNSLRAELPGHMVTLCLTFHGMPIFSTVVAPFNIPTSNIWGLQFSTSLPTLIIFHFVKLSKSVSSSTKWEECLPFSHLFKSFFECWKGSTYKWWFNNHHWLDSRPERQTFNKQLYSKCFYKYCDT